MPALLGNSDRPEVQRTDGHEGLLGSFTSSIMRFMYINEFVPFNTFGEPDSWEIYCKKKVRIYLEEFVFIFLKK